MGNGIFLATAVVDGKPTFFQYTMRPDDPVVIVELYRPSKDDLVPRPVDMLTAFGHNLVNDRDRLKPDTGVISEGSVDSIGYLSQSISEQVEQLGREHWAAVLAKNGEPRPANWDEVVKDGVTKFLESPDAARRLVERVAEDAVVVKINPLNYPEPLRQHILSTPHLERGVDDAES